jgi:hypothetical protein
MEKLVVGDIRSKKKKKKKLYDMLIIKRFIFFKFIYFPFPDFF